MDDVDAIRNKLQKIYGHDMGDRTTNTLLKRLEGAPRKPKRESLDESTAVAIAYGDHMQAPDKVHLASLHDFCKTYLSGLVSHVHILPFYPYSSDDGFSVIDYLAVDPKLGSWQNIKAFEADFSLMFDFVLNHMSAQSEWFQAFLRDDPRYRNFFITLDLATDTSIVRRPRTSPLLTPFATAAGTKHVWTTFSADQIDLNYKNPDVLLAMIDVLLLYVQKGAEFIRMDAVTYLWKEIGTDCVHLEQTHLVVQLFRNVLNIVAPGVQIITETNVPHSENISYFADGRSEAQGVYNFALPPLLAHTLQTGDKTAFDAWAKSLVLPSDDAFFFNFTASHDGIGVTPVKGILSTDQINNLIDGVKRNGGLVSYKATPDGLQEPYELNTAYYNALSGPDDDRSMADARFMVSQAVMLALKGVPGIYIGSIVGNKNWINGPKELGYNRAINREKLQVGDEQFVRELEDVTSERGAIFSKYTQLLKVRSSHAAFSPRAAMEILDVHPGVIAIRRTADDGEVIVALHSVVELSVQFAIEGRHVNLLTRETCQQMMTLQPYEVAWLREM